METCFLLQIKKPHKLFNRGDYVFGQRWDGQAERMRVIGWSSKFNKKIGASDDNWIEKYYYMKYQGWTNDRPNKKGHMKIIKEELQNIDALHILSSKNIGEYLRRIKTLLAGNLADN